MNDKASPAISSESAQPGYLKYYLIGGGVLVAVLAAYMIFGGRGGTNVKPIVPPEREDPVQTARTSLGKSGDLNTCRDALTQINQHLGQHPATDLWRLTPAEKVMFQQQSDVERQAMWTDTLRGLVKELAPVQGEIFGKLNEDQRERLRKSVERELTDEAAPAKKDSIAGEFGLTLEPFAFAVSSAFRLAFLKRHFGLKNDEWAEVNSGTFTLLDGHHLDASFLLRDVAVSFTREGVLLGNQPVQQAAAAFAWTVRQVRLQEGRDADADPLPPQFVLRRAQGTALERALVFLALLQQFDVPGCLIMAPDALPGKVPLWTCGALVDGEIYLFDPRMGIPLLGPNDEGIATLAAVQKQPELLKQITMDDAHRYDVTAEQARKAQVFLVCPLSALAPRMRFLESTLRNIDIPAPVVGGRLAADPAQALILAEKAIARGDEKERSAVKFWLPAKSMLRGILPPDEGGIDREQRWAILHQTLAPIAAFPKQLRDRGRIGQMMLEKFGTPFVEFLTAPQHPRDQVLRGRFAEASSRLTSIRQETAKHKARFEADKDLPTRVKDSLRKLTDIQAELQRLQREVGADAAKDPAVQDVQTRMENAWQQNLAVLDVLVEGSAAGPRGVEVNYQLALCKHEQAERLQLRLEEAVRAGKRLSAIESDEVRRAWQNAAEWWGTYLQEFSDAPTAPAARFQAHRARLMLGERDAAIELLKDISGKLTEWEQTARRFLARQLEKKKE